MESNEALLREEECPWQGCVEPFGHGHAAEPPAPHAELERLCDAAEEPAPENDCYDRREIATHHGHGCALGHWQHRTREARIAIKTLATPEAARRYLAADRDKATLVRALEAIEKYSVSSSPHAQECVEIAHEALAQRREGA